MYYISVSGIHGFLCSWMQLYLINIHKLLFLKFETEYPELHKIKRELSLLQKLYSLYNSVTDNINGYNEILWNDLNIEKINNDLLDFQNK